MSQILLPPENEVIEGVPYYKETNIDSTPGIEQTLISDSVPALTTRKFRRVFVSCSFESVWELRTGTELLGAARTGPGSPNAVFDWTPKRSVGASTLVELKFTQRSNSPVLKVKAFIMAEDIT